MSWLRLIKWSVPLCAFRDHLCPLDISCSCIPFSWQTSHVRSFCGIYFPCFFFFLWFVLSLAYPFYVPPLIRLASGKHSSGCRVWAGCASGLPQQPVQSRSLLAAGHGKRIAQQWMHSRCFFRLLATKLCGVASGLGQQWVGAEWAWKILKAGCNGSRIGTGYTRNIF